MEANKFKIKFCTGNANKLKEFQEITKEVFECEAIKIDCRETWTNSVPELQGEPEEISKEKVREAYRHAKCPIVIEDTSLCFNALGGLPGPYM